MKHLLFRLAALLLTLTATLAQAQTIPNPSFEADTFNNVPGYASSNGGSITGWVTSTPDRVGLNPANGSPFADNGVIPEGSKVAFIVGNGKPAAGVLWSLRDLRVRV